MKLSDAQKLAAALTDTYGLAMAARMGRDDRGDYVEMTAEDVDRSESFAVRVSIGWKSIEAEFQPGAFSGELIADMGRADNSKKRVFLSIANSLLRDRAELKMLINDQIVDSQAVEAWPTDWHRLQLTMHRSPIDLDHDDDQQTTREVFSWGGRFLGMIIALLPLEENEEDPDVQGYPEGAKERIEVNRYERSRINRAACLAIHGYLCKACDFDFANIYGEIGEQFIHVHHVTPVSMLGGSYILDPAKDLVPVCPNCHAMLHRRVPPFSIDELRTTLANVGKKHHAKS